MLASNQHHQAGFTLIEILIAITLLAFITFGVVSVTQNAADTMERTTEVNKNNLSIETAMSRIEWDFSQIYTPLFFSTPMNLTANLDPDGNGINDETGARIEQNPTAPVNLELQEYYQRLQQRFEQSEQFVGLSKEGLPIPRFHSPDKTTFEFFTSSNRRKMENTRQSHFAWVRYTLGDPIQREQNNINDEAKSKIPQGLKALVRYFNANDPYHDKRMEPGDGDTKGSVLLENVESLEFQFWDLGNRKWESNLRTIQNGETIIRGLKIIITWYDSSGFKRTAERIFKNSWPMVIPNDKVQPQGNQAGATAGAQGSTQNGTATGSGNGTTGTAEGETEGGTDGEN